MVFCKTKQKTHRELTTVVLYEPQVRELRPHIGLDVVEAASERRDFS